MRIGPLVTLTLLPWESAEAGISTLPLRLSCCFYPWWGKNNLLLGYCIQAVWNYKWFIRTWWRWHSFDFPEYSYSCSQPALCRDPGSYVYGAVIKDTAPAGHGARKPVQSVDVTNVNIPAPELYCCAGLQLGLLQNSRADAALPL